MKKSLATAALAGSLLVAPTTPAQATPAVEVCEQFGPELGDKLNCVLSYGATVFNAACAFVPPSIECGWWNEG